MDGRRFDDAARALGAGANRRRVLAGALGAALGALGLGRAAAAQDGPRRNPCDGVRCRAGQQCCDECGTARCRSARRPCPRPICPDPAPDRCATIHCAPGETCCPNCGICLPLGADCDAIRCAGDTHAGATD